MDARGVSGSHELTHESGPFALWEGKGCAFDVLNPNAAQHALREVEGRLLGIRCLSLCTERCNALSPSRAPLRTKEGKPFKAVFDRLPTELQRLVLLLKRFGPPLRRLFPRAQFWGLGTGVPVMSKYCMC